MVRGLEHSAYEKWLRFVKGEITATVDYNYLKRKV